MDTLENYLLILFSLDPSTFCTPPESILWYSFYWKSQFGSVGDSRSPTLPLTDYALGFTLQTPTEGFIELARANSLYDNLHYQIGPRYVPLSFLLRRSLRYLSYPSVHDRLDGEFTLT